MKYRAQDIAQKTTFPFLRTVKAKLLIAFCLIVSLNVIIGSIGWRGFTNTEQALKSLRDDSLPDIGRAMELAKRSSAIAAIAPFVGSIQVMNRLNVESDSLDEQLVDFRTLVDAVEPGGAARGGTLRSLAERLETDLRGLVQNTRESLGIRSDMLELRYSFDRRNQIEAIIRKTTPVITQAPAATRLTAFQGMVATVFEAMGAESPVTIMALQSDFSKFSERLNGKSDAASDISGRSPQDAAISEFVASQARVFELRRRELSAHEKTKYLLATIHAVSLQLSDRVTEVAGRTMTTAQLRSSETDAALERGKGRILPLTLISMIAGGLAAFYVLRNLAGNLQAVTSAMARLAAGDRSTNVPAVDRMDEFGSLARAFNVFKEQSFDREALANDLIDKSRTLAATFANMTDGMSVFDSAGCLVAWNPQFLEINELNPATITQGMHFRQIVGQLVSAGVAATFMDGSVAHPDELFRQRTTEAIRYEHRFRNGRTVELRSHPMPGGFTTIYTDLTEQRAMERQLRQSQRMDAVGQLTSGIAHDFNNLLAAVSGNLQMLHEMLHDRPDLTQRILRALEAAERGATVTQRLLAFSRQQALQPEITDLNALIVNLLELLSYSLGPNIAVETDLQPALQKVFVDPGQFENAILNLVFNSRDAMRTGGTIRVETALLRDGDDSSVRIRVSDNGAGMMADVLARVYEPFFTTKEKGSGSGLGLSMVYGFVTQSGGQIDIESEPGAGTLVSITMPTLEDGVATRSHWPLDPKSVAQGGAEYLLVVEDDPIVRETVADMLTSLGYRTVVTGDAEEAKIELDRSTFDLLFTDVMLTGGLNGVDIAAYARDVQPDIAVLYTSGHPPGRLEQDMVLGSDVRLLGKPYRKEALAAALRSLLEGRHSKPKRSTDGLNL